MRSFLFNGQQKGQQIKAKANHLIATTFPIIKSKTDKALKTAQITTDKLTKNFHKTISEVFGDESLLSNSKRLETNTNSIADYLPYKFYDSVNQIFINESTIGFILETGSLFGANPKDIQTISNLLRDNIEEGTTVQILNYASPRTGNLLEHYKDFRSNAKLQIKTSIDKRVNFLSKSNLHDFSNSNSAFRTRNFRIFFIVSVPTSASSTTNNILNTIQTVQDFIASFKNNNNSNKQNNQDNKDGQDNHGNSNESKSNTSTNTPHPKQLNETIESLKRTRQNFTSLLETIGFGSHIIQAEELIRFLDEILNANSTDSFESSKTYNPIELLNKQIINHENDIEVNEDSITLHASNSTKKAVAKCFSIKEYPESFSQDKAINLIGDYESDLGQIPCPFLQTIIIYFPYHSDKQKDKIRTLNIKLQKNKENPFYRFFPEVSEKAEEYAFVRKQMEAGQKLVDIWNQVMLIGSQDIIDTASRNLLSLYGRSGFTICIDKYFSLQSFLGFLPFTASEGLFQDLKAAKRTDKVLSWTCANIAPLQGEPKGHTNKPCMLLFGRRGQVHFFHPFLAPSGGNFNTCIVGKSGSGKSFFMQDYMESLAGLGARMIVVDDGQSFQRMCLNLKGKYIEFAEGNNICLNPFTLLGAKKELLLTKKAEDDTEDFSDNNDNQAKHTFYDEIVHFIKQLIKSIITEEDALCSKEESELIGSAVEEAIKRKRDKATLLTVSEILLEEYNNTTKRATRPQSITDLHYNISLKMNAFTIGEYSKYFNGKANIEIDTDCVVFELSHIKNKPDLQKVVTLYASFLGFKEMYLGNKNIIKSFVVDEAWALLAGKEMSKFMEEMARRARKYNGQLVIATQNIDDFYKSAATTAILQNSDYLCILAQKPESITALEKSGKIGDMSPHLKNTLLSVKTKKGQYSEVLIYAHGSYFVARLIVDPFSAKLYSSDAKEFKQIEELMQSGLSLTEALEITSNGLNTKTVQNIERE